MGPEFFRKGLYRKTMTFVVAPVVSLVLVACGPNGNVTSTGGSTEWYSSIEQVLTNNGFITAISQDPYPRSTYKSEIPPYEDMLEVDLPGYQGAILGFTPADPTGGGPGHDAEYRAYCADGISTVFQVAVTKREGYAVVEAQLIFGQPSAESLDVLQELLGSDPDAQSLSHFVCSDGALSHTG